MGDELPSWLNAEFLEKALQEGDEDRKVHVVNFYGKLALAPGDNFTSHIYRVKVEYKVESRTSALEEVSLMVKAPVTKGIISDMQSKIDLFATEPRVYHELLPKLKKKIDQDFGPKVYPCEGKGMILKDLRPDGYSMCDRLKQLSFSHCKLALTLLAKFHAGSVACYHDDPEFVMEIGKERFYSENSQLPEMKGWFTTAAGTVGGMLKESEGCEKAVDYILNKGETLMDSLIELCKPQENSLNVLNHGDFWMNNMLFKHDGEGEVIDVRFVDFQVVRYTSPALDLIYFLYTSTNEEARSRMKELLDSYLETLNSTLELLHCEERLSQSQLEEEIKRCTDWAVMSICNVLPIVLCDPVNVINMEDFSQDDFKDAESAGKYLQIFTSKEYKANIPKFAKYFQNQFLT